MPKRLLAIVRKESREVLRDPIYLWLAIAVPLVVMTLLAEGFVLDVKNLPIGVCDLDRSPGSREYMYAFTNSEYFKLIALPDDFREADQLLQSARVRAVVVIPPDFSRLLAAGRRPVVQVLVDGSFAGRALVASGYIAAIDSQYTAQVAAAYLARRGLASSILSPVSVEGRVWFNPSLEAKNSTVPGLLVISLMFYPGLLAALVVVREKERGTIFNLYGSPVSRWEVIAGKAVPYIGLAFVDYLLLFAMSVWLFDVRFVGSFFVLTVSALLYITCCIGLGLVISVLSSTQVAAMLATFLGLMTPSMLFSGMLTPIGSMDRSARVISRLIPASYFMSMARGVFLKGLGFRQYGNDLASLALFGVVVFAVAVIAFRKRVA